MTKLLHTRFAFFLAVAALVVALVLWSQMGPNRASRLDTMEPSSSNADESQQTVANPQPELPAESPSATDVSRDRVEGGRRIQVLDPSGTAVPNAIVRVQDSAEYTTERMLDYYRAAPRKVDWGIQKWRFVTADENGIAHFAGDGVAIVASVQPGMFGWAVVETRGDSASGANKSSVTKLRLQPAPMIELIPRGPLGEVLQSRIQLMGYTRSSEEERWGRNGADVGQLKDGRWLMCLGVMGGPELPSDTASLAQCRATLRSDRLTVEREFSPSDTGPIELQLPECGEIWITLEGYPSGVRPHLRNESNVYDGAFDLTRVQPEMKDGAFVMRQVPVGMQFGVQLMTESDPENPRGVMRGVIMEPEIIAGPERHGEVVEHTARFQPPPGFYGRLVFPEEMPMPRYQILGERRLIAKMVLSGGSQHVDNLDLSIYPDGSFVARIPHRLLLLGDQSLFGDVLFEVVLPKPLFARVAAKLPSLDTAVNVGEIRLELAPPLLKVRVVNEAGEPLPEIEVLREWSMTSSGAPNWIGEWATRSLRTDANGEIWFTDRDWYTEFERFPPGMGERESPAIDEIRVSARHPERVTQRHIISTNQTELEIVLPSAGQLTGAVLPVPGIQQVSMALVAPGAAADDPINHVSPSALLKWSKPNTKEVFKLEGIPAGSWDCVFSINGVGVSEVLRIPGVVVRPGEVCADPRLKQVDLQHALHFAQLRFVDSKGHSLTPSESFQPRLIFESKLNQEVATNAQWTSDSYWAAIPANGFASVRVFCEGYLTQSIEALRPGSRSVQMQAVEPRKIVIASEPKLLQGQFLLIDFIPQDRPTEATRVRWGEQGGALAPPREGAYLVKWQYLRDRKWERAESAIEISAPLTEVGAAIKLAWPY